MLQGNNSLETSPYLLSPGTDRVNQAAGVVSGELLWAGVSPLNGKKVHCTFEEERERAPWRSARNKIYRASQAQSLTPSIQGSRAPCYVGNSAGWELVWSSTLFPAAWWSLNHPSLPVHFLPTFFPEVWRVELCLQAGRPGLWFHFCQQLCDLGLHFSIPPSSISLLNGNSQMSNRHKARRIEPGDLKVPFLFIIQLQCIPGGPLAACYLEAKPTFNICSFIALPTPLPVYFTFPNPQIWFCPPRWQMMYYMHSLLRNVNLT